jgi:transposase InsO family protein
MKNPIVSNQWMMDEICQRLPNKKRLFIITVFADDTRYMLTAYVCPSRSFKSACKALEIARDRAKSDPHIVRSDANKSYEKAGHCIFPNAKIISVAKADYLGNISRLERGHESLREGAMYKRRLFFSPITAQMYADFARFHYNFIRLHSTLKTTPAKASGLPHEITDWRDLFYTARSFYKKKIRNRNQ